MGVYIKGMEMPKEGYKVIYVHSNGSVYQPSNAENIWHKIASAVPVPPHGRLIDADAMAELWKGCKIEGSIKPFLDTRPTIIEAEGKT